MNQPDPNAAETKPTPVQVSVAQQALLDTVKQGNVQGIATWMGVLDDLGVSASDALNMNPNRTE